MNTHNYTLFNSKLGFFSTVQHHTGIFFFSLCHMPDRILPKMRLDLVTIKGLRIAVMVSLNKTSFAVMKLLLVIKRHSHI